MSELSRTGRMFVTRAHILLAFVSLSLFGSLHLLTDPQTSLGYIELMGGGAFLLDYLFLLLARQLRPAQHIFLGLVLIYLQIMLITGGTAHTGNFWFFVFPVSAFFLMGKRRGLFWLTALFVATLGTWLLAASGQFDLAYSNVEIRQLLVSLLVVSGGIYAYQRSRERLQHETAQTQRQLDDEKVRADDIVQHIGEGIVTTDARGRVTFINQAGEHILGRRAAELLGERFIQSVPMRDQTGHEIDASNRPLQQALQAGRAVTTAATYQRADGMLVPVAVTSMPVVSGGRTIGAIGTFRDLSEEQSIVRAKSEFITVASHQLRTPISAISWLSELLLSGDAGKLSAQQHEHVQAIHDSNQRMANLVSDMLMVSHLDLGSLPILPEPTDLPKLANSVIAELTHDAKGKLPQLTQTHDQSLEPIAVDPSITKLILRHLLSNAIKYTSAKGHVEFDIKLSRQAKVRPQSRGSVVITISDNGYGIPERSSHHVFDKFFRGANILHKDTNGTGLGLYIVKSLLDYVGGHISFTSHENQGTVFTVLLPLEGMTKHEPAMPPRAEMAKTVTGVAHV